MRIKPEKQLINFDFDEFGNIKGIKKSISDTLLLWIFFTDKYGGSKKVSMNVFDLNFCISFYCTRHPDSAARQQVVARKSVHNNFVN